MGVSGYVVVDGGGSYEESRIWFCEIFKKDPKREIVRYPFWEEEGNKSSDTEEFVVQEGLREVYFHRVGCRALEDFENQACMEESSPNCGSGDEDDVRSSEWEVVSLSLSSHSLAASTTFETAAGTGQEKIGGEAVDVVFNLTTVSSLLLLLLLLRHPLMNSNSKQFLVAMMMMMVNP